MAFKVITVGIPFLRENLFANGKIDLHSHFYE